MEGNASNGRVLNGSRVPQGVGNPISVGKKVKHEYSNLRNLADVCLSCQTIFVFLPLSCFAFIPFAGPVLVIISSFAGLLITWALVKGGKKYRLILDYVPNLALLLSFVIFFLTAVVCGFLVSYQTKIRPCYQTASLINASSGQMTSFPVVPGVEISPPYDIYSVRAFCTLPYWPIWTLIIFGGVIPILNLVQFIFFCIVAVRVMSVSHKIRRGMIPPIESFVDNSPTGTHPIARVNAQNRNTQQPRNTVSPNIIGSLRSYLSGNEQPSYTPDQPPSNPNVMGPQNNNRYDTNPQSSPPAYYDVVQDPQNCTYSSASNSQRPAQLPYRQ